MAVLVTGGAGYIGSHTCVELLENNKEVVVLDNLSNSSEEALNRVKRITGKEVKFYKGDISDIVILDTIFKKENIESCIINYYDCCLKYYGMWFLAYHLQDIH